MKFVWLKLVIFLFKIVKCLHQVAIKHTRLKRLDILFPDEKRSIRILI